MTAPRPSLGEYDHRTYGPLLGVSDEGSAVEAIAAAALASPKARALSEPTPIQIGVAHDAERLGSIGEVPVGPDAYRTIRAGAEGRLFMTTNVGSHVAAWHYLQPPSLPVFSDASPEQVAAWADEWGGRLRGREPRPWLRLLFEPDVKEGTRREVVPAASGKAPVAIAVRAEEGRAAVDAALALAADGGAEAVVVDGLTRSPVAGRPALPGLLNYFEIDETRELLALARTRGVTIEPALKVDTESVANQIWSCLATARAEGCHLGKYGLFPLTLQEGERVIKRVQSWLSDWTTAPAIYVDVPAVDGDDVYELEHAATTARRWLEVAAAAGASVVLIDTVEKSRGLHLVKSDAGDEQGILSWEDVDRLESLGADLDVRILWAGGISLPQLREFGSRRPFGLYVTSAVSEALSPRADEEDIGLATVKEPDREKVLLARLLLDAGFFNEGSLNHDADEAARGNSESAKRLDDALIDCWRRQLGSARD